MHVWMNGRLLAREDAHVPVTDRGLLLGDGLFETMAVRNGEVCDLHGHLERLKSGLGVLRFGEAVDTDELGPAIKQYICSQKATCGVLRLTVTRGTGPRGLAPPAEVSPTLLMTLSPMPPRREAISLRIVTVTRRNEHSPLSRIKALPYLDNVLALLQARASGADEALLLNTRGAIACASAANIFVIRDGCLETPPIEDGALPGTTRARILSWAGEAGLAPREVSLSPQAVAGADHVFLTNSVSLVQEARDCEGRSLNRRAASAIDRLRSLLMSATQ